MKKLLTLFSLLLMGNVQAQDQFTVYFDFDIDETNESSEQKLSKWIGENPNISVNKIYGYTDSVGEAIYNTDLSERRATHVYSQLKQAGIKVDDAELKGFGETMATGKSKADRKVVLHFTVSENMVSPQNDAKPVTPFTQKVTTANKGDKIRIPNLNFYNNSDVLLPESQPVLNELLAIMQSKPLLKIDIQGHICCQIAEENSISQRRAEAVYKFLSKNGIDTSRLSYKSFGSTRPLYKLPEKTEAEKVANRRVEIEIIEN